jgi:hypothetical protein
VSVPVNGAIPALATLGDEIATRWHSSGYDPHALPDVAAEVLLKQRTAEHVDYSDVLQSVMSDDGLPYQQNLSSKFGEPPITVYWHPKFYIEVLFWVTATTTIHQHGFSGAFAVLEGTSVEGLYRFTPERRLGAGAWLGQLTLCAVKRLRRGDVQPISGGSGLIHSVFHLDTPTVTIVVRTPRDAEVGPQYDYWPPSLCIDANAGDPLESRRSQCLQLLARSRSPCLEAAALQAVRSLNAVGLIHLMRDVRGFLQGTSVFDHMWQAASQRFGCAGEELRAVFAEYERRALIRASREEIVDPDLRLLLALLLTIPDREAILARIREWFPGQEPLPLVSAWFERLSGRSAMGIHFDPLSVALCQQLVVGASDGACFGRLREQYDACDVDTNADELIHHIRSLRSGLLAPLFAVTSGQLLESL